MARNAKWAKTQREARESAAAEIDGGGHLLSDVLRLQSRYVGSRYVVAPKPSTSHDARSLTAVGSNDPWNSPAAGNVTSSLTAGGEISSLTTVSALPELEVDWEVWVAHAQPNRDPESYVEADVNIPSPTDEDPWRAAWPSKTHPPFGIFGSVPGPVASSPTAVGDQPAKYSQRTLCAEYKDKEFAAMVEEFKKFDSIAFARTYDFTMSTNTDPVSKQISTRLREMRNLVFDVLPDHAARHLKWWKTQCAAMRRTFRKDNTQPVYVISLWATSLKAGSKYQAFWAQVLDLIKDFDPDELDDNLVLSYFLKQPFTKPGAICLAITDSTWQAYAPSWCPTQQERWETDRVCDYKKGWRTEQVGNWLQHAMESDAWPSKGWSCVHQWSPLSPLSMSELWKAAAAGPIVTLDEWTKSTNNTNVKKWCTKYLNKLLEPALKRAKGLRTHQTAVRVRKFFDSSYGVEEATKAEKKTGILFNVVEPKPSPVTTSVTVTLVDYVICSTGLNGANPGTPGLYDQPATYVSAEGPQMPYEIHEGLSNLVDTASSLGKFTHVSAAQCATTYKYRNPTEWQQAAEKSCHDIKYDSSLNKEYTIDTCAGIERDGIRTRADLGHWDSWHFVTHKLTCETVMRHELNKLKLMECMYPDEEQMKGWIDLLTLGRSSSSASSLTAAGGSTNDQPESLSELIPSVIPFTPTFIPGLTAGTTAEAPIIYQICDGDVLAGPDSHEPDGPGTEVPESPALPKTAPLAASRQPAAAQQKRQRSHPKYTYTVSEHVADARRDPRSYSCPQNVNPSAIAYSSSEPTLRKWWESRPSSAPLPVPRGPPREAPPVPPVPRGPFLREASSPTEQPVPTEVPPPTSPVPTDDAAEEGLIEEHLSRLMLQSTTGPLAATSEVVPEEEQSIANSRQRAGSLTAVGSPGTRSPSVPAASPTPDDVFDDEAYGRRYYTYNDGGRSLYAIIKRHYRPSAWTGFWKMGKPRCATNNCPYACTGLASHRCCIWCGNNSGKHCKTCAKCWHIPAVSEWEDNDWLVDGLPSKYALLLPDEREAFNNLGLSPVNFNSMPSVEQGWWRADVPGDTVTPPASDNGAPVVPWHLPVGLCYTHDVTTWGFILPIVVAHNNGWTRHEHFGTCGQGCPCCGSHCKVDGSSCDECYDGWVLTCVCKSFYIYILDIAQGYPASAAASIETHNPAPLAIEVGPGLAPIERASYRLDQYHRQSDKTPQQHWHKYLEVKGRSLPGGMRLYERGYTPQNANQDLLKYLKSPHRRELMRANDWNAIFGKPIVESEPDEHRERLAPSASSLTAASVAGETDVLLDASSLTAAGSSDRPPINPRPMMIGAKPKSRPTSNKIPGKNLPSEKPTSKSKPAPRTHSTLRYTPSVSCAVAWERVIDDNVTIKALRNDRFSGSITLRTRCLTGCSQTGPLVYPARSSLSMPLRGCRRQDLKGPTRFLRSRFPRSTHGRSPPADRPNS